MFEHIIKNIKTDWLVFRKKKTPLEGFREKQQRFDSRLDEYRMLLDWDEWDVKEYMAGGGSWSSDPPKRFYKRIADRWREYGFPMQGSRVEIDGLVREKSEAEKRRKYEWKMREERYNRAKANPKPKPEFVNYDEPKYKKPDEWGFVDVSGETGFDLDWEIPKSNPSNAKEVRRSTAGEVKETPYKPADVLTEEEEEMILNHPKYTLFVDKAETIKPLWLQGKSNPEISKELGDGFSEATVKRYTSIFRKCSPFFEK